MKSSKRIPLWLLIAITLLVFCWGMCWGRYQISIHDFISVLLSKVMSIPETWSQNTENAVWIIRFPRLCGAFLVGAALAISGATYQGIFQNPLVSPDLLGGFRRSLRRRFHCHFTGLGQRRHSNSGVNWRTIGGWNNHLNSPFFP